jgi:hypothetical protein
MKIFKYTLEITDQQPLNLPTGSTLLSAREQNGMLCVWALVDDTQEAKTLYNICIIGTGNPMLLPDNAVFLDTVIMSYGLVWHVFYVRS